MRYSEEIKDLAKAMAAAQSELENPPKEKTAKAGSYSYKYADIADVLNAARPVLTKHGLAVFQTTSVRESGLVLLTRIVHTSGQWVEGEYPVASAREMKHQDIGAAMTYARRYALTAMIGVAAEEDTDAHHSAPVRPSRGPSKADSRPIYERLQNTMRACKTVEALNEWSARHNEEIARLPEDWKALLRKEWAEQRDFLDAPSGDSETDADQ